MGEENKTKCDRIMASFVLNSKLSWVWQLLEMVQLVLVDQMAEK